jgi:hypothetical protein
MPRFQFWEYDMKFQILSFVIVGSLLTSSFVFGGDKDRQAKAAFNNAVKLFKDGSYEEAADEFRRANAFKPAFSLLYNIGQSEAAAKRYGLAYDAFEEYLSLGGDDITEQRRNQVTTELERLSQMIGSVEVVAPPGCTVLVDDMDRGVAPLPGRIKLAVGVVHKLEIKKGEETIHTNNVKVSYGEVIREEVKEEPAAAGSPAPTSTEEPGPAESESSLTTSEKNLPATNSENADRYKPVKVASIVTLASGGAMLGAAIATGVVAIKKNSTLKSDCDNSVCQVGDQSEILSRDTLALTTDVLIGVGATAAVVGAVLFVWSNKKSKNRETSGLRMTPLVGPRVAGLGFSGEF